MNAFADRHCHRDEGQHVDTGDTHCLSLTKNAYEIIPSTPHLLLNDLAATMDCRLIDIGGARRGDRGIGL
jgi:hypothetical protein